MTAKAAFLTSTGLSGTWSEPPKYWSYSSLAEVRACPRRYALRRATYSDLWDRSGYPDRVTESAIAGTVVHDGVETIVHALKAAGCSSLGDVRAVGALRDLGGYTSIATTATWKALSSLEDNPRMLSHVARLADRLRRRTPEMRRAIQTLVSRMPLAVDEELAAGDLGHPATGERTRINRGVHPEATLIADDERFTGRIDLLTLQLDRADILDFKTGQPAAHHSDQVTLYGLLWMLDKGANPDQVPVGALTVAYIDRDLSVPVPDDWDAVLRKLEEQIALADQALVESPPKAIPSTECRYCPVRHLCDVYWQSPYAAPDPSSPYGDVEVGVLGRNGPRSWFVQLLGGSGEALLRTATEFEAFDIGQRLRVLDAVITETADDGCTIVTITASSETYSMVTS